MHFLLQTAKPCPLCSYTTGAAPGKLQWTELRGCQSSEPLLKLK